ncbi:MAG: CotH kinase family protein, partial [Chthoniobacterales bacterium]
MALGVSLFAGSLSANPVINEVQSTNTGLPDQYGNLMDWVEIYNPTGGTIDLSGYFLSDSTSNRIKYTFPAGTTIAAGAYLTIWCGTTSEYPLGTTAGGPIPSYPAGQVRTTNFAISSGGEPVVLSSPDPTPDNGTVEAGSIVDQYPALAIGTSGGVGRSLGRGTGDSFETLYFYTSPTRGTVNNTSGSEAFPLDPPTFSLAGGVYTSAQTLELNSTVSNAVIRYTTDGSDPTDSSPIYSNAITLTNPARTPNSGIAYVPSNNLGGGDEDRWITPSEAPARINVVRAKVFKTGNSPSRTVTRSYVVNVLGTNRHQFPIVSLATSPGNLTNNSNGLYVYGTNTYPTNWSPTGTNGAVPEAFWANYFQKGSGWERSGNVEIFERTGSTLLSGEIGLRINGQTTRVRPRKALRIYNRNTAGSTVWNAQLFPDKNITNHERFILRASGNDWSRTLFRDAYMSDLAAGLSLDRQHTRPVVLFLSGEYWGIHNLRDRLDEPWVFHHYGLGESDYGFIEVTYGAANFLNEISDNSAPIYDHGNEAMLDDYKDILTRAGNNEFATAGSYTNLDARIDLENYIDYMAVTIFGGNTDWPGNNMQMWRSVTNLNDPARPKVDGRWRYVIKDNDFALGMDFNYVPGYAADAAEMAQFDVLAHASSSVSNAFANNEIATRLFRKVLENPVFRTNFVNRYADLLNSTLSTNNTLALLQRYAETYSPGVEEHFKRWPVDGQNPTNYWTNVALARVRTYLTARTEAVRSHVQNRFGIGTAALTVSVNNTNAGTVTVNRLNINPATPGLPNSNAPYPWTGTYFQDVAIPITAVANPGYRFTSWTLAGSTNGASTVIASDSTANYGSWTNGANGGTGFGAWVFSETGAGSDGFFIGTSGRRIHNASPDQQSFGIFAHTDNGGSPNASASATRLFGSTLGTNQTFSVKISPGGCAPSSHKGVQFGTSATNWFEFFASDFGSSPAYYFRNGGTTTRIDSGSFWANSDYTFDLSVTRTASNSYSVTIARGSQSFTTNLTSATTVDRAYFYSFGNPNGDDTNNLYFNLPRISQVAATDTNSSTSTNSTVSVTLAASRTLTANFEFAGATAVVIEPAASPVAGSALSILVKAVDSQGNTDANYTSSVTLTISGPNGYSQSLSANAVAGVATFSGLNLPEGGSYTLGATSGSLTAESGTAYTVADGAVFTAAGNAVWNTATNWNTGVVPNTTTARTLFSGEATNRNINLSTNTTVAAIIATNSVARNRFQAASTTSGITMRLESASGPSLIRVVAGAGTGNTGFEFAGNTALRFASDVVLDVLNTNAASAEFGALRFQANVSGTGNITKRGPGHAGFTGTGKTFSGNILVEQGVLGFSATGASNASTNITVQAGGQLRLSAAQSGAQVTNGTPILHP